MPAQPKQQSHAVLTGVVDAVSSLILGKRHQVELALACLLARGHLLIEDVPGVGKTTLAHTLARVLGLQFSRIQFTADLLPTDILGVSMFDRERATFEFQPGPIFAELVLADEINRASPKSQSALLEAMQEQQVTIDGTTRRLPEPFFVIATQNPDEQSGTFELPESQIDRFLMRIKLGYPSDHAERTLLTEPARNDLLPQVQPVLDADKLTLLQHAADNIHVSEAALDYILALVNESRQSMAFVTGLSPRAGLALRHGAQAWAMIHARDHVLPEDIQAVLDAVVGHRLVAAADATATYTAGEQLRAAVAIP